MNYPPGALHDPDAPWNARDGEPCPDCGDTMTERDVDGNGTVEYECTRCDYTETVCYGDN